MDAVFAFQDELERQDKQPATVLAYARDLEAFVRWLRAEAPSSSPAAATEAQLDAYRAHLLGSGAALASVARSLAALRAFLRWARATGLRRGSAAIAGIRRPRAPARRLGEAELAAFVPAVEQAGNARDLAVVLLLVRARLRVGEVARLRLDETTVGPDAGALTVRAARATSRRVVLDPSTCRAVAGYLAVRPASTHKELFLSQLGGGLTASGVHGLVVGHARRAGLVGVTPSALRRSAD